MKEKKRSALTEFVKISIIILSYSPTLVVIYRILSFIRTEKARLGVTKPFFGVFFF